MNKLICPVPQDQRPLNEFNSLRNSWIISWPLLDKGIFYRKLILSWLFIIPFSLVISYGSDYLRENISNLVSISLTCSLILPILLLSRQWLSWKYIFQRLNSEKIEYEESGWYDGQIWEKPVEWRSKELLIAQHQVKPILDHIKNVLFLIIFIIVVSFYFIIININL